MHVAAAAPQYVTKEEVPAAVLDKEKEIYRAQAAAQGKPAQVQEKIAEGKLKEFYSNVCLMEQPFIRDGKQTVGQLVQEKIALIKENIVVRRFARFKVGEELQAASKPADEPLVPAAS
jgi:elongation factor Ts